MKEVGDAGDAIVSAAYELVLLDLMLPDGRRYAHTIDPRRAAPLANDLASVTVLAPTAMAADAWATALMVLGAEAGAELARRVGPRAIFVAREGEAHGTG